MKILLLGSTGFVGLNIHETLKHSFNVIPTSRSKNSEYFYFDFKDRNSWNEVINLNPDVIINSTGYGVVKTETDIQQIYELNYLLPSDFYNLIYKSITPLWVQIGTAFEYSLDAVEIKENTPCNPRTHYGISKFMMSNFIHSQDNKKFLILRPFGMFGPSEDPTKFFPGLINAQIDKKTINLSDGSQRRDYFFVRDLARFIGILLNKDFINLPNVINLGSNKSFTLKEYSMELAQLIENFDPLLWNWAALSHRQNENDNFYNASSLGQELGFQVSTRKDAFKETINFYKNV